MSNVAAAAAYCLAAWSAGSISARLNWAEPEIQIGVFQQFELRRRLDDGVKTLLRRVKRLQGRIGLLGIERADGGKKIADALVVPRLGDARVRGIGLDETPPGVDGQIVGLAVLKANGHIILTGRGLVVFAVKRRRRSKTMPPARRPNRPSPEPSSKFPSRIHQPFLVSYQNRTERTVPKPS